jgi:hypothetical protein
LIATDGASALGADRESFTGCDHGGFAKDTKEEDNKMKAVQSMAPRLPRLLRVRRERFDCNVVFMQQTSRWTSSHAGHFLRFNHRLLWELASQPAKFGPALTFEWEIGPTAKQ